MLDIVLCNRSFLKVVNCLLILRIVKEHLAWMSLPAIHHRFIVNVTSVNVFKINWIWRVNGVRKFFIVVKSVYMRIWSTMTRFVLVLRISRSGMANVNQSRKQDRDLLVLETLTTLVTYHQVFNAWVIL